jgi:hypothetical protein
MPRRIGPSGKFTKVCCATVGIGWLLTVDLIRAGPPFVTDDPEPPPPGGWEINVPFILERTPGKTEMDAPLFDLNYGLPNVQLKLEFPVEIVHEDGAGTAAGTGDLVLGVKWRFWNNERTQLHSAPIRSWWRPRATVRAASARVSLLVAVSRAEKLG